MSLPGGAVEPGETPQEAVLREVLEETGVVAAIDAAISTYELDDGFVVHVFECSVVSGTPRVPMLPPILKLAIDSKTQRDVYDHHIVWDEPLPATA